MQQTHNLQYVFHGLRRLGLEERVNQAPKQIGRSFPMAEGLDLNQNRLNLMLVQEQGSELEPE